MAEEQGDIVLVTGGSGLVGRGLMWAVRARATSAADAGDAESDDVFEKAIRVGTTTYHFLTSKDADLTDMAQTRSLFERFRPTVVVHLAAMVGGLFKNMKLKVEFFHANMAMNENILKLSHEFGVKKTVTCLSTCIFPDKTTYPIDETMIHLGPPHPSNEGYAYSKRMVDVLNRVYHEEYGSHFTSIIPTNVYGPHDNYHPEDSHVIPGLIRKCAHAKEHDEPFVIWGSGKPLRQFIYSRDLGRLILWVVESYDQVEPIILSVGEKDEVSIADVALGIRDAMGFTGEVTFDTSKADGQFKKTASNAKLVALHPTFEFTPFETAIRQSVDWFVEHKDNDARM